MIDSSPKLQVFAIHPRRDRPSLVTFSVDVPGMDEPVWIEMPYHSDDPTTGVKEAADDLADLFQSLAEIARGLAI